MKTRSDLARLHGRPPIKGLAFERDRFDSHYTVTVETIEVTDEVYRRVEDAIELCRKDPAAFRKMFPKSFPPDV